MHIEHRDGRLVVYDPEFVRPASQLWLACLTFSPLLLVIALTYPKGLTVGGAALLVGLSIGAFAYLCRRLYRVRLELDPVSRSAMLIKTRLTGAKETVDLSFDQIDLFVVRSAVGSLNLYHRDDYPVMVLRDGRRLSISGLSSARSDARLIAVVAELNRFIAR